ncbi:MAG TPA: ATP-binding cassette domain-containing protein, partial [Kofleriaceae bacterium]|nr:ATP-binding cassette domain-containing protein [Kofleriaceae bacterium]
LENVLLPVEILGLDRRAHRRKAEELLGLVGLAGFEEFFPSEISGGMLKRAGVARAMALDPDILFFDEPSAGLDPVVAAEIDELLLRYRDVLGITLVVVTHHLESVRSIADRAIMVGRGRVIASGTIQELEHSADRDVHAFFHRIPLARAA